MLTIKSTINVISQAVQPVISAVQGDNGRTVEFTVADFTIPTGATAVCHIRQPSGNVSENNATIEDNNIIVNLTADDTAEIGDNFGQIRITSEDKTVTSYDFLLVVNLFRGTNIGG